MARVRWRLEPATADRWDDLAALFGARGACGGCWCMWWRIPRAAFQAGKGDGNRLLFQRVVRSGAAPGLLAYDGDAPVGWVAVAPRSVYPRLSGSRILAPVDEAPVWSITCLFVTRGHRGRGVSVALLRAAAEWARGQGAPAIEGYPVDASARQPDAFVYTGLRSAFLKAGYREVARRSRTRPIMRRTFRKRSG